MKIVKVKPEDIQSSGRPFHISIGTSNAMALDMEHDLRLLRTALLYADKVKLCSYSASYLYALYGYATSPDGFLDAMEAGALLIRDHTKKAIELQKIEYYRRLLRKKRRSREELVALSQLRIRGAALQNQLKEQYPTLTNRADFEGMRSAVRSNILDLHAYQYLSFEALAQEKHKEEDLAKLAIEPPTSNEDAYKEFVEVLSEVLKNTSTYPLFDDNAGLLAAKGLDESPAGISPIRLAQAKHSATAANMLERLPDFGLTPIDSILDIRKELRPYLVNFRGGIKTYSNRIQSAPWSRDFAPEADEVFVAEVYPAFLALEDSIKSSKSILKELKDVKALAKHATSASAAAAFGWFIEDYASLPVYIRMAFGLSASISATLLQWALNALNDTPEVKRNALYFYYRLRDKVER
jgi:hypothetical protein